MQANAAASPSSYRVYPFESAKGNTERIRRARAVAQPGDRIELWPDRAEWSAHPEGVVIRTLKTWSDDEPDHFLLNGEQMVFDCTALCVPHNHWAYCPSGIMHPACDMQQLRLNDSEIIYRGSSAD